MRFIWIIILAVATVACAGRLETKPLSEREMKNPRNTMEGVIYHPGRYVKLTYKFSTLQDSTGKVIGRADDHECTSEIEREEVQIMPDYTRGYLLSFRPGLLNNGKIIVNFDRGMLTAINAENSSQVASVVESASSLVGAVRSEESTSEARAGSPVACNAAPRLDGFSKLNLE